MASKLNERKINVHDFFAIVGFLFVSWGALIEANNQTPRFVPCTWVRVSYLSKDLLQEIAIRYDLHQQ